MDNILSTDMASYRRRLKLFLKTQISRDERCWYNDIRGYQQVLFILYTKRKLKRRHSYCKKDFHSTGQRNP